MDAKRRRDLAPPDESRPRGQGWRAAVLALTSGYVDAYVLQHYKVYASFMSGNTTSAGLRAGQGRLADAGHDLLPIPFFVIGSFAGALLIAGRPAPLRRVCVLVAALLSGGFVVRSLHWEAELITIVLLTLAMGIVNSAITRVGGQPLGLGFISGNLNKLGEHLALASRGAPVSQSQGSWDTHGWRVALLSTTWASFLLGAVLCGPAMSRFGSLVLLPPILLVCAVGLSARDRNR